MNTKKVCVILSLLFLGSSQISAINFTGVRVINKSCTSIQTQIQFSSKDMKETNWEKIYQATDPKKPNQFDIKSDKGRRFIRWRDLAEPNIIYSTMKDYGSPDTLTIKDGKGKKKYEYDMASGIGGLDKDNNQSPYIKNTNIEKLETEIKKIQKDIDAYNADVKKTGKINPKKLTTLNSNKADKETKLKAEKARVDELKDIKTT